MYPPTVRISRELLSQLEDVAVKSLPSEACALLAGYKTKAYHTVDAVHISENMTAGNPINSFEINPQLHIDLQRQLRGSNRDIIGVWHSHPCGAPEPSEQDCSQSMIGAWVWLISGVTGMQAKTRAHIAGVHNPHVFTRAMIDYA